MKSNFLRDPVEEFLEPYHKKMKLNEKESNETNILKLSKKGETCMVNSDENEDDDCIIIENETESIEPQQKMGIIWVRDIRTLVQERFLKNVFATFTSENIFHQKKDSANETVIESNVPSTSFTTMMYLIQLLILS